MRKMSALLLALTAAAALAGCSGSKPAETTAAPTTAAATAAETKAPETTAAETKAPETTAAETKAPETAATAGDGVTVRIGSLKGPTSMGLVALMDQAEKGEAANTYEFTMAAGADELNPKLISGDLDIILVPANVASVLSNKTNGGIVVLDINTLGVLDVVAADDSIKSVADLKGKTVYMTGKGTTPDYAIHYLMSANDMTDDDVTLEFKSEAAEVAAVLKENPDAIALLPQPFVTATMMQNEGLKIVLDLTEEWDKVQGEGGSRMVTGVTIARRAFVEEHPEAAAAFLEEHKASAEFTASNPDEAAALIEKTGIVAKAPIAKKALPYCNITCLTGEEMKTALSGYLNVLFEQNPQAVGGALPADEFYFVQ